MPRMLELLEGQEFVLGGRTFRATPSEDILLDQAMYTGAAVEEAGLGTELAAEMAPFVEEALANGGKTTDQASLALSQKIILRAFRGRVYLDVLSGMLDELVGGTVQEWTRESAIENAEFFKTLKGADIQRAQTVLVQGVLGFFMNGLASMTTFPKSSSLKDAVGVGAMGTMGVTARPADPAPVPGSAPTVM